MPIYQEILRYTNQNWDARPRTLIEFLNNNKLSIPDYQRPYSWEEIHVEALLKDIGEINDNNSDNSQWFLGCFYTASNEYAGAAMLLDGQQRFTTIYLTILISIQFLIKGGVASSESINKNEEILAKLCYLLFDVSADMPKMQLVREIKEPWQTLMKKVSRLSSCTSDNDDKLKDALVEFKSKSAHIARTLGVYSGQRISENLEIISKYLKTEFLTNGNYNNAGIREFIDKALNKLWMIEIPLTADSKSISIFEGLNNRGKALTLSDKLVFKAIRQIKWEANKITIRSRLYTLISRIEKLSQYFTEDQFWKYYLMSELGKSITREDFTLKEYVTIFQGECDDLNEHKERDTSPVFKLVDKLEKILSSFELIKTHGSDAYESLVSGGINEKYKVKSLLKTLDKALLYRDFNCVLFMYLIKSSGPTIEIAGNSNVNWQFLHGSFNIIRFSHLFGAFSAKQSNEYRNYIISAISQNKQLTNTHEWIYASKKKEDEFIQIHPRIQQEFFTNDSRKQNIFTIYLYMLVESHVALGQQDSVSHQHETIEHIFPRTWKEHWSPLEFSKQALAEYCLSRVEQLEEASKLDSVHKYLYDTITSSDVSIGTTGINEKESLGLELIGNKIVLDNEHNSTASNKSLEDKLMCYESAATIYPKKILNEEITMISNWDYKSIIDNTIDVTDKIWKFLYKDKNGLNDLNH